MVDLESSWKKILADELIKPYFERIWLFIRAEIKSGKTIFPKVENIFSAFESTPFDQVKVVILGQDPYHGEGQAHGLCFSVQKNCAIPPSLKNIYKEIESDLSVQMPKNGYLQSWAEQGVLLLNTTLTVEAHQANSHRDIGWQRFTDAVIQKISAQRSGVVFLLWGRYAQSKGKLIDSTKHHVLTAPHPSPLSAYRGFFGCRHFSQTNELLQLANKEVINWERI